MTVIATLELRLDPSSLDKARAVLAAVLDQTRAFDGNLGVQVLVDTADESHVTALETWESLGHDDAYRAWREGDGAPVDLFPLVTAPPVLTRWVQAD